MRWTCTTADKTSSHCERVKIQHHMFKFRFFNYKLILVPDLNFFEVVNLSISTFFLYSKFRNQYFSIPHSDTDFRYQYLVWYQGIDTKYRYQWYLTSLKDTQFKLSEGSHKYPTILHSKFGCVFQTPDLFEHKSFSIYFINKISSSIEKKERWSIKSNVISR